VGVQKARRIRFLMALLWTAFILLMGVLLVNQQFVDASPAVPEVKVASTSAALITDPAVAAAAATGGPSTVPVPEMSTSAGSPSLPATASTATQPSRPEVSASSARTSSATGPARPRPTASRPAPPLTVVSAPRQVYSKDFADADIVLDPATRLWHAFATNSAAGNIPQLVSANLADWIPAPDALPKISSQPGYQWAPCVIRRPDGVWAMAHTARGASGHLVIKIGVNSGIAGPYADDATTPVVVDTADRDSIDPQIVYVGPQPYLAWVQGGGPRGTGSQFVLQRLSSDLGHLTGGRTLLATSPITIEGIYLVVTDSKVRMLYAQGDYRTSAYQTRQVTGSLQQLVSTSPVSFSLAQSEPLLSTAPDGPVGPGEPVVPHDASGLPLTTDGQRLNGQPGATIYDFTNGLAGGIRTLWRATLSVTP
jgi:hypothetical protein